MPSDTSGFTGSELVARVVSYIGNTRTEFQTYIEQSLPLAEFRFGKLHDWRFLHKQNLPLAVTNGTSEYTLNVASIGYNMAAEDVETIWDDTNGRVLKKVSLKELRRMDPENDDGSSADEITHWAPVGDNTVEFYPPNFANATLRVDGKIQPNALSTLSNYPTIPYKYQESFLEYLYAIGLDKENDDRAATKKVEAIQLIQLDVKNDVGSIGDTDGEPRLKSQFEASVDGVGGNLETIYLNSLFR